MWGDEVIDCVSFILLMMVHIVHINCNVRKLWKLRTGNIWTIEMSVSDHIVASLGLGLDLSRFTAKIGLKTLSGICALLRFLCFG